MKIWAHRADQLCQRPFSTMDTHRMSPAPREPQYDTHFSLVLVTSIFFISFDMCAKQWSFASHRLCHRCSRVGGLVAMTKREDAQCQEKTDRSRTRSLLDFSRSLPLALAPSLRCHAASTTTAVCLPVILLFLSLFSALAILASLVICACDYAGVEAFAVSFSLRLLLLFQLSWAVQ